MDSLSSAELPAVDVSGAPKELAPELLDAVLSACSEGVWVVDADGRTILVNDRMLAMLGVTRAEFQPGARLEEHLPPAAKDQVRSKLALREVGVHDSYEVRLSLPGGRRRVLAVSGSPRYDRRGAYVGAIAMCSDVTAVEDLDDMLPEEAVAALEQLDAGPLSLSVRESQIVHRLLIGDRVPAIARSLSVSQSTIRNQLTSVFRKTGVRSQQDLVTLLRRLPHTTD